MENRYAHFCEDELRTVKRFKKRIVYGARKVGMDVLRYCQWNDIEVFAVAVSNKDINPPQIMNCPVRQIDELGYCKEDALVIVAMGMKNQTDVRVILNESGFKNVLYVNAM